MNQGQQANKTGRNLEGQINSLLISSGYKEIKNNEFNDHIKLFPDENVFCKHFVFGFSIYNRKIHADVLLYNKLKFPDRLAAEIKWQEVSGSVDEKFPYILENIRKKSPFKTIIILDGNGFKKGIREWLESQIDDKFIGVFSLTDFIKWVNHGGV